MAATWVMIKTYIFDRRYIQVVKVPIRLHIRKKKFTILKIRHLTIRSSLRYKECDVIGDLRILKPRRTWHQQYTKQYSFVSTFTNIFSIIEQEETRLLNHCLSTQSRPYVRPRAVFSFTNNNPQWINNASSEENNTSSNMRIINNRMVINLLL